MSRFAPKARTQSDRKQEVILFIYQAADKAVLATDATTLCARHGVTSKTDCREVEVKLLARQDVLRRQATAA